MLETKKQIRTTYLGIGAVAVFNSRTLFILGAGASCEAGLPMGTVLAERIAPKLDIRYRNFGELASGSREIVNALRLRGDINHLRQKGIRITEGVTLSPSIDNFLHNHQHDPDVQLCGKLGIAQTIMEAERASPLWMDHRNHDTRPVSQRIPNTWFLSFFKLLNSNVPKANINTLFDNVRVISFNYDRCIEYFLVEAITASYGVQPATAQDLVAGLNILHPFGSIGSLPWHGVQDDDAVPFGGHEDNPHSLLRVAEGIRTFNEKIEDEDSLSAIRAEVAAAEAIVFLGFAFHPINMELLSPTIRTPAERVYATAKGVSEADCEVIGSQIAGMLNHMPATCYVKKDMSCNDLFNEYWRSFSLA